MPRPVIGDCGGLNQPPCPPTPAAVTQETVLYTLSDMKAYGLTCYEKGKRDARVVDFPKGDDGPR